MYQTMSDWFHAERDLVWFSRTMIVNADRLSYTRWCVDADWLPLHLTLWSLV